MVWVVECQEATKPVANFSQAGIKTLNVIMTLIKQCLETGKQHNSIFEWLTDILACSHDDLPLSRMLVNLIFLINKAYRLLFFQDFALLLAKIRPYMFIDFLDFSAHLDYSIYIYSY